MIASSTSNFMVAVIGYTFQIIMQILTWFTWSSKCVHQRLVVKHETYNFILKPR